MRSLTGLFGLLPFFYGAWVEAYPYQQNQLVADPLPPGVKSKILVTDKPNDPAAKLVKIRHGPFIVPPNTLFQGLPEIAGGPKIAKPCDECFLGALQGGLEYEDGSEANADSDMFLHHLVISNDAKPDWLCGLRLVGVLRPQWMYNTGNDRSAVRLNGKHKFGMRVDKPDRFSATIELMNMSNVTKTVYTTMIYEVVPINTPGYREATHLRMDLWMCGGSDIPAKLGSYEYHSANWTSPYSGVILHNDGHGHDGTKEVNLYINGKVSCSSKQYYGLRSGWVEKSGMKHISDATVCEDTGRLEKGDVLMTEAVYDDTKHPQMKFRGKLDKVETHFNFDSSIQADFSQQMGISFMYIGRDENTLNDTLNLQPEYDTLPVEMKLASAAGQTVTIISKMLGGFNITSLLSEASGMDISTFLNTTEMTAFLLTLGIEPTSINWNSFLPHRASLNIPYGGFAPLSPEIALALPLIMHWIPGGSNIVTAGGFSLNDFDSLMDSVFGSMTGAVNPMSQYADWGWGAFM
jgi:hypothetical protein